MTLAKRTYRGPRHTTISLDPASAAAQNSENARDTLEALNSRLRQRVAVVERYTATGSSNTKIPIGASARPFSVQLAYASKYYAPDEPLPVVGDGNFAWEAASQSINVFEPYGLTADVVYRLGFIITEV